MKICPKCNRLSDDAQMFCLEDGTSLNLVSSSNSEQTLVLPRRRSKIPLIAGVLLLLLTGISVGGWFLLSPKQNNNNRNNEKVSLSPTLPVATATPTPILETPTPSPTVAPTPTIETLSNTNISVNTDIKVETPVVTKSPDSVVLPVIMKVEEHTVLFALHECRKSGSSITCLFSLTNKGQDRDFEVSVYKSKLYDESGNGYTGSDAQLANKTGDFPKIGFISGVTTKAQMTFEKIEQNTSKITLLRIGFQINNESDLTANFRNVPLIISK